MSKTTRKIDTSTVLLNLKNEPLTIKDEGKVRDMTLGDALLTYVASAHQMKAKDHDIPLLYSAGKKIAEEGVVELGQGEYDAVKRLADDGTLKGQSGAEHIFSIIISQQVKELVDGADVVKCEGDDKGGQPTKS